MDEPSEEEEEEENSEEDEENDVFFDRNAPIEKVYDCNKVMHSLVDVIPEFEQQFAKTKNCTFFFLFCVYF